jgi:hypothetical protein
MSFLREACAAGLGLALLPLEVAAVPERDQPKLVRMPDVMAIGVLAELMHARRGGRVPADQGLISS